MENPTATSDINGDDATGARPNIIMIMVDQMRFPMHLPLSIPDADRFIESFMPNLYQYIWSKGVRFANHYIAASDCTAGRATIYTGLYAYQTYLMLTLITYPDMPGSDSGQDTGQQGLPQPQLQPDFPTVGHLLREAGYDTPYFGKWHMSYEADDLERYGFESHAQAEDFIGLYGQGLECDNDIAEDAAAWVNERVTTVNKKPFFLSVNFVNPHDKQWFWGGTEVEKFNKIYETLSETPAQLYTHEIVPEDDPPPHGYLSDVQDFLNWESQTQLEAKPGAHTLVKEVFQYQMGGIYQEDEAVDYTPVPDLELASFWTAPTKLQDGKHKALAPYEYWSKALDSYIQVQQMVDGALGIFMESLPAEVRDNSVFVFTSDHGEYASSHGLQGKGGTIYEEGIRVPFVVYDPTGRFTAAVGQYRTQLSSSVDLLPMLVAMGHGGTYEWLEKNEDYTKLYGTRLDLLNILRDPNAPGRQHVLHTTDEFLPATVNFLNAPMHVVGTIFMDEAGHKQKLGVYTTWAGLDEAPQQAVLTLTGDTTEIEYYDHGTDGGAQELDNTGDSEKALEAISRYWGPEFEGPSPILQELQAPLPPAYREAQLKAYRRLQEYMATLNEASESAEPGQPDLPDLGVRNDLREKLARIWAF